MAKSEIGAQIRQPAAAPNPVTKNWVHDRADKAAVDHECRKPPSLSSAARRNRRRCIHEDHLEEEQSEGGGIVAGALEHETFPAQQSEKFHAPRRRLRYRRLRSRSEEHTSELQSLRHLVCRLLLEQKKKLKMTSS